MNLKTNIVPELPSDLPLQYIPNWLTQNTANTLFCELLHNIDWQTEGITMFGKKVIVPRKFAWFGEKDAIYRYSGVVHHPLPWVSSLKRIQERLAQEHNIQTNSVLCNLYKDGQDYMGWHQDKENELGRSPFIASISLGAPRKFVFRKKQAREKGSRETYTTVLGSGSLLIMQCGCQEKWQHCLPKMTQIIEPRINLTFRNVFHS